MTDHIDRYAVFGNPIAHSKSPQIHTLFAKQTNQMLVYTAELAPIGQFESAVTNFIKNQGKGLNITVPFKEDAWRLAAQLSQRAQRAGAVNTLSVQQDGSLYGDTTDGVGLVRDLMHNHHVNIKNQRLLIIGAGGAVRGILQDLLEQKPASILITNRTRAKALQLARDFSTLEYAATTVAGCGLDEIGDAPFDLIINGTSASLKGELPTLPDTIFAADACSYDMMYGTIPTPFMLWSKQHGAKKIFDGLGMLVEQAAESFYLWRKVRPETRPVITEIRNRLS